MTIGELLDTVREYYVKRFLTLASRYRDDGKSILVEPVLRQADGEPAVEGELALPVRSDIIVLEDGRVRESLLVDTEKMLSFEPILFTWDGTLRVTLVPFQWNCLEIALPGAGPVDDWTPLTRWFFTWFQPDREDQPSPSRAIHFLSDPDQGGNELRFTADLGTAPVESVEQLLDCLAQMGFKEAILGHREGV